MANVKRSGVPQGPLTLMNNLLILLFLYFPLCGNAYLAYLLIGSVSMFDFGCVGFRKKMECLGHFDLFVHIEKAERVGLNVKESITNLVQIIVCFKLYAKRFRS